MVNSEFELPPGQKPSSRLYPVSVFGKPKSIDKENYKVKITSEVEEEKVFALKEILSLPHVEKQFDIHCVDGWSYLGPLFEGVFPYELIKQVRVKSDVKFVLVKCIEGYSTDLPLNFLMSEDEILTFKMDGKDLSVEYGFPLRLVVNGKYAYKDAKWVVEFEFIKEDKRGYWEERGYSTEADIYKNQRRDF